MEILEIQGVSQPKVVFEAFLEECGSTILHLDAVLSQPDISQPGSISAIPEDASRNLAQSLHKLQGSFGFIGLEAPRVVAKRCEQEFRSGSGQLSESLKELRSIIVQLTDEIQSKI